MGCANMTPGQRTAAWIIGGVVVTSVVLSSGGSSGSPAVDSKNCPIHPLSTTPSGFTVVCK